ncbi:MULTISPECIES: aromatic ring-hydroxylating dioxygenase subunit alpha [unclassified Pseudomonas]|uniref:aromatic ring-hydroxylating dioxygenase subunit alpha n=1 Tax=unclassified Pseudomonas TaxID=196821 RepID=UPI0021C853F5|nr:MULTISPECIES: aromatic ring-hydroxylating dioxygenase subunit alpha [unclassified Pseudomonas]MCU1734155.1 aromatic ring-hydroxylating dioxygenase subunit alpha [Pseudomonas sp. 20P_3.2_Bac4]MCU1742816.1 aromatic ring-hydroxylating dioxygenase subunit alpha [Pseudomonas sp. 20P_3.2_Bac5]
MSASHAHALAHAIGATAEEPKFPLNQWYVAGFAWELKDKPLGRTLLGKPVVLFRTADGKAAALEDRCCHRALPLSSGTLEEQGLRCGYHGLLFDATGQCLEVPGQAKVPTKARVQAYPVQERDQIIWIWFGSASQPQPTIEPPAYEVHSSGEYVFEGGIYHYDAPYQLIHDNLLDLSHLGYVHLRTIGGNASVHMNAQMRVESDDTSVKVVRHMPGSQPPPTYSAAYPFKGKVDRWQEIEFLVSHLRIWTGAVDAGTDALDDPRRGGFHMRGFHGVTPETETTSHYFWTMATNPESNVEEVKAKVVEQTALTFDEDKVVIEAQYKNMLGFGPRPMVDIHVDVGANRARKIIERLRLASA